MNNHNDNINLDNTNNNNNNKIKFSVTEIIIISIILTACIIGTIWIINHSNNNKIIDRAMNLEAKKIEKVENNENVKKD